LAPDNLSRVDLGIVHLVGLGAIGNGVLWSITNVPNLNGRFTVIDHEKVSLSNLQRYVCTTEMDVDKSKAELASELLSAAKVGCDQFVGQWAQFASQNNNKLFELVVSAVDTAKDRIGIQSSLPKKILNAYTENNIAGITRHLHFGQTACLACGFVPEKKLRDYSQEVADNLGMPDAENFVRHYIAYDFPVDENLLTRISQTNNIPIEELNQFMGMPFSNFYSDAVCGGVILSLTSIEQANARMEAPLAFQSALAGVLLAAEIFLLSDGYRDAQFPNSTQLYPLLPIRQAINPYSTQLSKDTTQRCICMDSDFVEVYGAKWREI
jgi:hypothetical protein